MTNPMTIPADLPQFLPCGGCSGGVATLWHWQYHNGLTTYRCPDCGWKTREYASDLIDGTETPDTE